MVSAKPRTGASSQEGDRGQHGRLAAASRVRVYGCTVVRLYGCTGVRVCPLFTVSIGTHRGILIEREQRREKAIGVEGGGARRRVAAMAKDAALNIGNTQAPSLGVGTSPSSRTPSVLARMCPFPRLPSWFCVMSRRGLLPSTPRARVVDPVLL